MELEYRRDLPAAGKGGDLQMIHGEMQPFDLTLDKFLDHAAKWHPRREVVTAREDGGIDRIGYADLRARSLRVSSVLAGLGVRRGDRVATLAWNSQAHVEAWYAIMGMGAVCHTLNPRLTGAQLAAMVGAIRRAHPDRQRRPDAAGRARSPSACRRSSACWSSMGPRPASAGAAPGPRARAADRGSGHRHRLGRLRRDGAVRPVLHLGTTGAPKGVTYTHRSSFLHTLRLLQADVMAISGDGQRAGGGADVPCQCLGPALRGAGGGRQAGAAGAPRRWRQPGAADRRGRRDGRGRRAHRLARAASTISRPPAARCRRWSGSSWAARPSPPH